MEKETVEFPAHDAGTKKLGIDYLQMKVEKENSGHPYLLTWLQQPWLADIRKDPRFR
jgi:hypothetical protein